MEKVHKGGERTWKAAPRKMEKAASKAKKTVKEESKEGTINAANRGAREN